MKRNIYAVHFGPGQIVAVEISDATAAQLLLEGHTILLATPRELFQFARRHNRLLNVLIPCSGGHRPDTATPTEAENQTPAAADTALGAQPAAGRCPGPDLTSPKTEGKIWKLGERRLAAERPIRRTASLDEVVAQAYCEGYKIRRQWQPPLLSIMPAEPSIRHGKAC